LVVLLVALASVYPRAPPASARAEAAWPAPAGDRATGCVEALPEARYRSYGYDHIVHLRSRCATEVVCIVWTDVSPTRIQADLQPAQEIEVLTFRGSPARTFVSHVACQAVPR
jgi:hypothetical protein